MIGKEVRSLELLAGDFIDRTQNFLADFGGKIASSAGLCHHLVRELFRGGLDHLVVGDMAFGKDGRNRLKAVFTVFACHIHGRQFV